MSSRLNRWSRSMIESPRFTLMRAVARFSVPRHVLASTLSLPGRLRLASWVDAAQRRGVDPLMPNVDVQQTVANLETDGIALGFMSQPHATIDHDSRLLRWFGCRMPPKQLALRVGGMLVASPTSTSTP